LATVYDESKQGDIMAETIPLVVYPAKDAEASKQFFTTFLGTEPYVESDYYIGYKVGAMEVGLDPHGQAVIIYTDVSDIKDGIQSLLDAGGSLVQDAKEVGGGLLIAQVKDANGNVVGLRQETK
jgi:predicted enzyme related to lactoylglutathione lyase